MIEEKKIEPSPRREIQDGIRDDANNFQWLLASYATDNDHDRARTLSLADDPNGGAAHLIVNLKEIETKLNRFKSKLVGEMTKRHDNAAYIRECFAMWDERVFLALETKQLAMNEWDPPFSMQVRPV